MTSRTRRKDGQDASAAGLLAEVRSRPVPLCPPTPVYWRAQWSRPGPDAYAELLREAVLEAEDNDDGRAPEPRFAAGYAMGLRVAAGLYGMPEGADPATRKRYADDYPGGWFGESWGAPVCDPDTHKPTPADEICIDPECLRPIQPGDQGVLMPHTYAPGKWRLVAEHLDCLRRGLGGGRG